MAVPCGFIEVKATKIGDFREKGRLTGKAVLLQIKLSQLHSFNEVGADTKSILQIIFPSWNSALFPTRRTPLIHLGDKLAFCVCGTSWIIWCWLYQTQKARASFTQQLWRKIAKAFPPDSTWTRGIFVQKKGESPALVCYCEPSLSSSPSGSILFVSRSFMARVGHKRFLQHNIRKSNRVCIERSEGSGSAHQIYDSTDKCLTTILKGSTRSHTCSL